MYDPSYRNKYRLPFISFYLSNFFNFHNFDKWSILLDKSFAYCFNIILQ